ncbi:protein FAM221B [Aplysia californica]|uniref:Protein FAM221B n=1 Tax=Aplysia californica TaxID=6500 RepID=A0ABM0JSD9_APLCA|nr:protein FAM221B [Aplysia californica]
MKKGSGGGAVPKETGKTKSGSSSRSSGLPHGNAAPAKKTGAARPTGERSSKAPVPKGQQALMQKLQDAQMPIKKVNGMYVPEGYRMREIKPAKNYDVVSMAKAMNDDFAPKLKELFDTETAAAIEAQKTGIYIGWRCPEFQHDCQRVFHTSRCFCDHALSEHAQYNALSVKVPCRIPGCNCKAFEWIPNRPEDIGEFWLPKRPGFDAAAWRAKCKCKHTHNFHDVQRPHRCKSKGCGCSTFWSDFLCAACDRHWEDHQTFFDSEQSRREQGLPVGTDWLPFAEMPDLRNIALSGNEEDDSKYLALREYDAIPANAVTGNNEVVNFGGGRNPGTSRDFGGRGGRFGGAAGGGGGGRSGFRPVYD